MKRESLEDDGDEVILHVGKKGHEVAYTKPTKKPIPDKDQRGKFAKGNNGGPGRPRGSKARMDASHVIIESVMDAKWFREFVERTAIIAMAEPEGDCGRWVRTFFGGRPPNVNINLEGGETEQDGDDWDYLAKGRPYE